MLMEILMKIETRAKFSDFVGFVSGIDLKKDLDGKIVTI